MHKLKDLWYTLYRVMTSARPCNKVGHLFWFTNIAHETDDVILYIYSIHKHRWNPFKLQDYKMRLKQIRLNWINSMQVKWVIFTNVFFSWSLCLFKYVLSDGISQAFLPFRFVDVIVITVHDLFWNVGQANCILKYFENMMIHHFLENGWFCRENTYKCSSLVTKWQIILHFHCCFNNKYIPYFLV